jgi:hypothetical protein
MYDISLFEKICLNNREVKIDTEMYLTEYYKLKEYNLFKSAELAEANINIFVGYENQKILKAKGNHISYIFNDVTKEIVKVNNDYFSVKKIYENLQMIDWREFEYLSSAILEYCFGAINVITTQQTNDGGLDFQGKIPVLTTETKEIYGIIEVYGQSKKYADNVGIYDIKSFVAFANSKKRNYVHPAQLFMFFTTSDFADNSIKELDDNGFIGLSGFQIATLIFKHKNVLINKTEIINDILL